MAVPRHKTSKMKKRQRRSHHALTPGALSTCSHCNAQKEPHRVCHNCGHYRDVRKVEMEDF